MCKVCAQELLELQRKGPVINQAQLEMFPELIHGKIE